MNPPVATGVGDSLPSLLVVSPSGVPWLVPPLPWQGEVPAALRQGMSGVTGEVPVVEMLSTPCTFVEVVALRAGRYVPLFGWGPTVDEARRAAACLRRAFDPQADPRALEHTLDLVMHPKLQAKPLEALARAVLAGECPAWSLDLVAGMLGMLGASDRARESACAALDLAGTSRSVLRRLGAAGGGDLGAYREHYTALCMGESSLRDGPGSADLVVVRQWYDVVLARRWSGIDALRAASDGPVDASTRWLATTAAWLAGDERARGRLMDLAQSILDPVQPSLPRVMPLMAREMAELLANPWQLRWSHLQCAAARDHAAAAIRTWLTAASEVEPAEDERGALDPEPSQAGRSAVAARQLAGEFLLDWFVPDREARTRVDAWAARVLRTWHRLLGAERVARALPELTAEASP